MKQSHILTALFGIAVFVLMFGLSWGVTKFVSGRLLPAAVGKVNNNFTDVDPLFFEKRLLTQNPVTISPILKKGDYTYIRFYSGKNIISPILRYPTSALKNNSVSLMEFETKTVIGTAKVASSTSFPLPKLEEKIASVIDLPKLGPAMCISTQNASLLYKYMNSPRAYTFPSTIVPCDKEIINPTVAKGEDTGKPVSASAAKNGAYKKSKDTCDEIITKAKQYAMLAEMHDQALFRLNQELEHAETPGSGYNKQDINKRIAEEEKLKSEAKQNGKNEANKALSNCKDDSGVVQRAKEVLNRLK